MAVLALPSLGHNGSDRRRLCQIRTMCWFWERSIPKLIRFIVLHYRKANVEDRQTILKCCCQQWQG